MTTSSTQKKYKCTVTYDGSNYAGFQIQQNAPTVQQAIEKALAQIHKRPIIITASGRTDAGVHAKGQVFHFESDILMEEARWARAINTYLNKDIRIVESLEVPTDFHARYDVIKKEYRYFMHQGPYEDPFRRSYSHFVPYPLDLELINQGAKLLLGEHDFTAFSSARTRTRSKVRTIYQLEVKPKEDELMVICEGNGFLFNMVRIIVGTLLEIGQKKKTLSQLQEALLTKERKLTGVTAPAHGLFLWKVTY